MAACDGSVTPEQYALHRPALDTQAGSIMESLRGMNAGELAAAVKISLPMARRLVRMIYDFPDKRLGGEAIEAFTGVVFRAFGYRLLDDDARRRACGHVRIVSSLYGWLRPDDIVKPYRFDFTTALAPGGRNFAAYWREYVTGCLLDELEACGATPPGVLTGSGWAPRRRCGRPISARRLRAELSAPPTPTVSRPSAGNCSGRLCATAFHPPGS